MRRLRVPSLLRNDSAGYTIVTIDPPENQKAGCEPCPEPWSLYIYPHTDRVRCSPRSFKHYRSIPDSIGGRVPSVRNEEIALFSQRMTFWRETGVRNVARRDTVRLRPNPGQRNGKNLCRPHPRTRESLDPSVSQFQEQLNLIFDELR